MEVEQTLRVTSELLSFPQYSGREEAHVILQLRALNASELSSLKITKAFSPAEINLHEKAQILIYIFP